MDTVCNHFQSLAADAVAAWDGQDNADLVLLLEAKLGRLFNPDSSKHGAHEARVRAMVDPDSRAVWDLNHEDKASLRWLLGAVDSLKKERDEVRRERSNAYLTSVGLQRDLERIAGDALRVVADARKASA